VIGVAGARDERHTGRLRTGEGGEWEKESISNLKWEI